MSEHYEVGVEDENGIEYSEHAAESVARRVYAKEQAKLRAGQRLTLTRVTVLEAEEGFDE